jgi:hemerythrin-like domain-containing protein
MKPIGPLMVEHRLIERMIALLGQELTRIKDNAAIDPEFAFVDPVFLDMAVDFIRVYADRCHHGKEEGILFAELARKELSPEHRRLMEELIADHVQGRELTGKLVRAKENYLRNYDGALEDFQQQLSSLVEFYPRHIEKEDKHFFFPCLEYLSPAEQGEMLRKMDEFDQKLIHEKYTQVVERIEQGKLCKTCKH